MPAVVNLAPAGVHLLDTSAVILMMRHRQTASSEAIIPFATLGELVTGIFRSNRLFDEMERVLDTIAPTKTLFSTKHTSVWYGRIAAKLQRAGCLIPPNDIWNAALALEHDVPLLADDAHFYRVTDLRFIPVR